MGSERPPIRWHFPDGVPAEVRAAIADHYDQLLREATLLASTYRRETHLATLPTGTKIVLKEQRYPFKKWWRAWWQKKTLRQDYLNGRELNASGLNTPSPLAFGTSRDRGFGRRQYLVTDFLDDSTTLRDAWKASLRSDQPWEGIPLRETFVTFLVALYQSGFRHGDCHAGNILATKGRDGKPRLALIDLLPGRFKKYRQFPSFKIEHASFIKLFLSLFYTEPFFGRVVARSLCSFLQEVLPDPLPRRTWRKDLQNSIRSYYREIFLPRADTRHLRKSREFVFRDDSEYRLVFRKSSEGFLPDPAEAHHRLEQHLSGRPGPPVACDSPNGPVLLLPVSAQDATLQEISPTASPQSDPVLALWHHCHALAARALPVLNPLFAVQAHHRDRPTLGFVGLELPTELRRWTEIQRHAGQPLFREALLLRCRSLARHLMWENLRLGSLAPDDLLWERSDRGLHRFCLLDPRTITATTGSEDEAASKEALLRLAERVIGAPLDENEADLIKNASLSKWARHHPG